MAQFKWVTVLFFSNLNPVSVKDLNFTKPLDKSKIQCTLQSASVEKILKTYPPPKNYSKIPLTESVNKFMNYVTFILSKKDVATRFYEY